MQTGCGDEPRILKAVYVILFICIYRVSDLIVLLLALTQFVLLLVTGEPSRSLSRFSDALGHYVRQIVVYLGCNSDQKPYPFSDWPSVTGSDVESQCAEK